MPLKAFRGEKSVGAIAEEVYTGLTRKKLRKAAEAALLEANPQLKQLEKLPPGTILSIPEVPGLEFKGGRESVDPTDFLPSTLVPKLEAYRERFNKRDGDLEQELAHQEKALRQLKAPDHQAQLEELRKNIHARRESAERQAEHLNECIQEMIDRLSS